MGKIITIIGNTGVGKTSLVRALANYPLFVGGFEQHQERPFQNMFKENPRFALANQLDYLMFRAEQEKGLRDGENIGLLDGGLEQDFFGFTQLFHSKNWLSDDEFDLCRRFYQYCRALMPPPDLYIYLTAPQEIIERRLEARKRINIASNVDIAVLDEFLRNWFIRLDPKQVIFIDVANVSSSYQEITPELFNKIKDHFHI